jgi:nitrite reductase/ring-hydroxylating ferredoxin subunit
MTIMIVVVIVSVSQHQQPNHNATSRTMIVVTALVPNGGNNYQQHDTKLYPTMGRHRAGALSHQYRLSSIPFVVLAKKGTIDEEEKESSSSSSNTLFNFWSNNIILLTKGSNDLEPNDSGNKKDKIKKKDVTGKADDNNDDDATSVKGTSAIPFIGRLFPSNPNSSNSNDGERDRNENEDDDDDDDSNNSNKDLLSKSSRRIAKILQARQIDRDAEELREEVLRREEERKRQLEEQQRLAKERKRNVASRSRNSSGGTLPILPVAMKAKNMIMNEADRLADIDRKIQAQKDVDQKRIDRVAQIKKERYQRELPARLQNDLDRAKRIEKKLAKKALLQATATTTITTTKSAASSKVGTKVSSKSTIRPSKVSSAGGREGMKTKDKVVDESSYTDGDVSSDDGGDKFNVVGVAQKFITTMFDTFMSPKEQEEWIVVVPKTRISPGEIVPVTIAGLDLLLVASKDGSSLYCIANSCPHLGTPLELATLERRPIETPSSSSNTASGETQSTSASSSADNNNITFPSRLFLETDITKMLKQDGCEDCIVCPLHQTAFALESGDVRGEWCPYPPVIGKLTGAVKKESSLAVFDVRTKGKFIEVRLNTPLSS